MVQKRIQLKALEFKFRDDSKFFCKGDIVVIRKNEVFIQQLLKIRYPLFVLFILSFLLKAGLFIVHTTVVYSIFEIESTKSNIFDYQYYSNLFANSYFYILKILILKFKQ